MKPSCTSDITKSTRSMDNNNGQSFGNLQPSACLLLAATAISRPPDASKAAPVKTHLLTYGSGTMMWC